MTRTRWEDLPVLVREAVVEQVGKVFSVAPAPCGAGAQIVATLHTAAGPIFLKGVRLDGPRAEVRRIEYRVQPYLPQVAPRLLWHAEAAGWLLLAFEHVDGRHADLSLGSPDLPAIAELLTALSVVRCPGLPVLPVERRWAPFADGADLRLLRGDTLVHMDLTAENILIGDRVRVVDWAWPTLGAAWLDTAAMVVRLIQAGHTPAQAERWAQQVPVWHHAKDQALSIYLQARTALGRKHAHEPVYQALARWQVHRTT